MVQAWKRRGRSEETATVENPVPTGAFFSIGAEYPGGTTTAILNAVRLASCVFLLASAAFTTLYWADDSWLQCGICITYVRAREILVSCLNAYLLTFLHLGICGVSWDLGLTSQGIISNISTEASRLRPHRAVACLPIP